MPTKQEIKDFSQAVENLVFNERFTYLEAIQTLAEKKKIEIETAAKLLSLTVKARLLEQAEALNLVKKSKKRKLPV